ncbi:uncharacterized protein OCT59_000432 [Rhizophagus irregularis]|uniref:uncharacterized protein n=1 Tax=Rhizophagus irregularis TaxID=588596 RepID=UPI00332CD692|nr:hypothetical protein OCT59_000432 [Rhizophagus irregularis]
MNSSIYPGYNASNNIFLMTAQRRTLCNEKISKYFPFIPPEEHIHVVVKSPLLSLKEALTCIPPPITYSPKCTKSEKKTTKPDKVVFIRKDFYYSFSQSLDSRPKKMERKISSNKLGKKRA